MVAFYDELLKQNTSLWSSMTESMGNLGHGGMQGMSSFWREAGGKSMERMLKGGFPNRIGPACFHQEKLDDAVKQMGTLNMALLEFTSYMALPVEAAFKQAMKEMGSGSSPEEWKAFGERMMRHMETGYQGLFTSKGYIDALDMLMVAAGEARHQVMGVGDDVLTAAGVPTVKEMDALSKDLYLLTKRVSALEKERAAARPADAPQKSPAEPAVEGAEKRTSPVSGAAEKKPTPVAAGGEGKPGVKG